MGVEVEIEVRLKLDSEVVRWLERFDDVRVDEYVSAIVVGRYRQDAGERHTVRLARRWQGVSEERN